jgi:hypothetical protein
VDASSVRAEARRRIWFTVDVDDRVVCITDVHTHHPNQTK